MTAKLIEKTLTSTLGYMPIIENLTTEADLMIGTASVPTGETLDDPGTHIGFVVDPGRRAMAIRIGDHDTYLVHPIDGPDRMTLRMVVRVFDDQEWSDIRDNGGLQAMSLLFGGQPDAKGQLSWDDIQIREKSDIAMIELQATSRDRMATARLAREMRGDYGWVPTSLRDAIFEIGVGSSDAPGPDTMGYEIVDMECWPGLFDSHPWARTALEICRRDDEKGVALLDELVEGDLAVARGSWPSGGRPEMVSVGGDGRINRISHDDLLRHLPEPSPEPSL